MTEVWTPEDLKNHLKKNGGKLRKPSGDKYKYSIEKVLHDLGVRYVKEYQFCVGRKFRFDFAIPSIKCAVEYEGTMGAKSRHTNVMGYSKDCEKYNLAVIEGWKVLRYTALNYGSCSADFKLLLNVNVGK